MWEKWTRCGRVQRRAQQTYIEYSNQKRSKWSSRVFLCVFSVAHAETWGWWVGNVKLRWEVYSPLKSVTAIPIRSQYNIATDYARSCYLITLSNDSIYWTLKGWLVPTDNRLSKWKERQGIIVCIDSSPHPWLVVYARKAVDAIMDA